MAKFGSPDLKISIGSVAAPTTPVDMTAYITEFNGIEVEGMTEEITTFGDTFVENQTVGLKKLADLTVKGFYDDTASTGPDVVLYGTGGTGVGITRDIKVTYNALAGSNYRQHTLKAVLVSYKILTATGELTKFEAVFKPAEASAVTYVTNGGTP